MDPSSSSASNLNGRQKRVLPSRTRRGGPGVGNCDTDVMILEHQKRRFETEAIIPPNTPFLLTTNSEVFSNADGFADTAVTTVTSERYFDRPDVLKAYREQLTIQTPSYTYVADNPSVGGRFRPRGPEDAQIDTSDAAYERRHRKYETFEKRQRLREKEKLKHEQYKLKERIEQLRVMDASAFLALPASNFTPAPQVSEYSTEADISNLPGSHVNGTPTYNEGERRRKEMLDIALGLEERYRTLLPPERLRRLQSQPASTREHGTPLLIPAPGKTSLPRTVSDAVESEREEEEEEEEIYIDEHNPRQERFKIKLRLGGSASQSPAPTTASRASRRSARTSVPPGQKPATRRRSRAYEPSWSPTPPPSPTKLAELSQLASDTTAEIPSPGIQPQEAEDTEEEDIPPPPSALQSVSSSELKPEVAMEEIISRSPSRAHVAPPPSMLPQELSPLTNSRPAPAPELIPGLLEQDVREREPTSPKEAPSLEPKRHLRDSPIDVDKEPSLSPAPAPSRSGSPPSVEHPQNASASPELNETNTEPRARPTIAGRTEEGSRLLELANAVQSITATPPPVKRQKIRHSEPLNPQTLPVPSLPLATELEPGLAPTAASGTDIPASGDASFTNGPLGRSASPSVPPFMSMNTSVVASASISAASAKRRYKKKTVSYQSADTGQTMYTQSLLLIAGIRGGVRQTQRHQTAFGVKVPEEISDGRDFELPIEYWPQEELIKYYGYYGLEIPGAEEQAEQETSDIDNDKDLEPSTPAADGQRK